ncbi:hypothetical protein NLJ89_g4508 [Agrocybe chaxingu]|uniref:Uncharacterized protein n=1 Tax=Agrocybe chaxingu TaxID=84603 RepID=A0A9W8K205_9AGAR|nr:hypothetical protein NLJ89_g4508 [Agrocybe chaxingu]
MSVTLPANTQALMDDIAAVLINSSLGGIFTAMSYGIAFVLFVVCFRLLLRSTKRTKHTRIFLLVYLAFMFSLSTLALLSGLVLHINITRQSFWLFLEHAGVIEEYSFVRHIAPEKLLDWSMVAATWAADGFLLWRCCVLYDAARLSWRIALYCLFGVLILLSFLSGSFYAIPTGDRALNLVVFASITLSVNVVICGLIVGRLVYHQRYLRSAIGRGYGSPYRRIISMCVESASLVVIFDAVAIFLFASPPLFKRSPNVFVPIVAQIYVISAFLIIYKVTREEPLPPGPLDLRTADIEEAMNRLETSSTDREEASIRHHPSVIQMQSLPAR